MTDFYHVWFSTKGRKPAIEGEIGDDIKRLLTETAERTMIRLLEVATVADHAHMLIEVTKEQTLPGIMHRLKGTSARKIFLMYPSLKLDMEHTSFWQKGYGRRKITPAEIPTMKNYIRTQQDRSLRHNG